MAFIVLLLSELLGGESASVLAAERYMGGHRIEPGGVPAGRDRDAGQAWPTASGRPARGRRGDRAFAVLHRHFDSSRPDIL
jgi:hypothetical protein